MDPKQTENHLCPTAAHADINSDNTKMHSSSKNKGKCSPEINSKENNLRKCLKYQDDTQRTYIQCSYRPNIIAISEKWINSENKHLIAKLAIPKYKLFIKDCLYRVARRVLICANNNLSALKIGKVDTHTYDSLY